MTPKSLVVLLLRDQMQSFALRMTRRYRDLVDRDDVISAVDLGLLKAVRGFDPAKGPITPFAMIWVRREVLLLVKQEITWKRRRFQHTILLEDDQIDPHDEAERSQLMRIVDDRQHAIWRAHVAHGSTVRELAASHQTSIRQIQNAIARSQRQLVRKLAPSRLSDWRTKSRSNPALPDMDVSE